MRSLSSRQNLVVIHVDKCLNKTDDGILGIKKSDINQHLFYL